MSTDDPRLRDIIGKNLNQPAVQLLGFPSDEGVIINGGRPGASKAPQLIYDELLKLTPHPVHIDRHTKLLKKTESLTHLNCSRDLSADQENLGESTAGFLSDQVLPVILGGGHETAFGHFLGYAKSTRPVNIVNIDAHADVREFKNGKPHSGSPFRQAIEHQSGMCRSYNVYGLNPASVSAGHLAFVRKQGNAVFEQSISADAILNRLNLFDEESIMVTMDMDAVRQADAPGVSAPNASGISKDDWLKLAYGFGNHPKVTSFDLCEVNPEFDRDNQTVKLAALTVWYFLLGVALR
ncbi:formimidoylglutamase [Rhodohalobacter barkolensis]|uniref:Arginase n=1 Tax=Rhodohalobacter barkolensis TaxID=2053187 RepID=A0A2N0VEI1_9BACT|nr:formimidoylglutamase [Rhodohalobacter barkolensis]PKD42599.1 arginase [Rhodohalobacter barkolensis]